MVTVLMVMVIRVIMATNVTKVIKARKVAKNAKCKSVEMGNQVNSEIHLSQALLLVQVLGMMGMIDQER